MKTFFRLLLSQPFIPDRFLFFYKLVNHEDFEQILTTCIQKVMAQMKVPNIPAIKDLCTLSTLNHHYRISFSITESIDSFENALLIYIRRDVQDISPAFLFKSINRYKGNNDGRDIEESIMFLKDYISDNIAKLVGFVVMDRYSWIITGLLN